MWQLKSKMTSDAAHNVHLILPEEALTVIFDECDGFDRDETGGRVIGTFTDTGGKLTIRVTGIIESGPQATRSPVSFFQDGEHQEAIFRQIERDQPEIEHLGNWHTHHVNGLSTLSSGDVDTYSRIVNHKNHNTSFFYALLVTAKHQTADPLHRYSLKHFLFRRGDKRFYEIPARQVKIVDSPLVWPTAVKKTQPNKTHDVPSVGVQPDRVLDRDIIGEYYPGFRPLASKKLGFYWRGPLELVDGSKVEVVLLEDSAARTPTYSVTLRDCSDSLKGIAEELSRKEYPSARAALIITERSCNRALFHQRGDSQTSHTNRGR